jgi:hypothetical protein
MIKTFFDMVQLLALRECVIAGRSELDHRPTDDVADADAFEVLADSIEGDRLDRVANFTVRGQGQPLVLDDVPEVGPDEVLVQVWV